MTPIDYPAYGGSHPETAAASNVLRSIGVLNPHSGQPCSEAMLLGVGGGLGAGYFVFEFTGLPPAIAIGARHDWQMSPGLFAAGALRNMGAQVDVAETTGRKGSDAALRAALERGQPAILAVDRASVPHTLMNPQEVKYYYHLVVATGIDGDIVTLDDRAPHPLRISFDQLSTARGMITSMKRRMVVAQPGNQPDSLDDAIEAGIAAHVEGLLNPPIRNFGLASLEKWADLIVNRRDKKGWPTVFPPGWKLYHGLASIVRWIEGMDNGGSLMRGMYADFLDEASDVMGRPALRDVANLYRSLATMWSDFAVAAMPDDVPPLGEARQLIAQRDRLFRERGEEATTKLIEQGQRLNAIAADMETSFPLDDAQASDLLAALRDRLLVIHRAEVEAVTALQR